MYSSEAEGRDDFIEKFEIKNIERQVFSDGVLNGNIFEFKLVVNDINATLFQAIKYLSRLRIQGKLIPKNINLISLNDKKAYIFNSGDFIGYIADIYNISASKNNEGFKTDILPVVIEYEKEKDLIYKLIEENNFTRVPVDIYNVIGLSKIYYDLDYTKTKGDFFNELRNPTEHYLKNYILPWTGQESDFRFVMDVLNAKQNKKELGVFYTPLQYVNFMTDNLLRPAIKQAKELIGKGEFEDYVILDRCSGTGNLEYYLTDEELSHCILNTYELQEWFLLNNNYCTRVRKILPENIDLENPFVEDGNVLGTDILAGIKEYVENPKCLIIMLENPPYSDETAMKDEGEIKESKNKNSFIALQMKKQKSWGSATNDIANQFIWSAFNIYMKKPEDCYILFSPIKYWKSLKICNNEFIDGFLFNRKHFHATPSSISCIKWTGKKEERESLSLFAIDIVDDNLVSIKDIEVKKVHKKTSSLYDKRKFEDDTEINDWCLGNGEITDRHRVRSFRGKNLIGYLNTCAYGIDPKNVSLTRLTRYDGNGFPLRDDNFIEKLPLFCAKLYPQKEWYEKDIYFATADGNERHLEDKSFLKNCFIFSCLSQKNHCLSLKGTDGFLYQNELCFDDDTISSNKLKEFELTEMDEEILKDWWKVLVEAKKVTFIEGRNNGYNEKYKYGLYQIEKELNTKWKDRTDKNHYDYVNLNSLINILKDSLKKYYDKKVLPGLFEYELLK
jgi:hypothetical protein